MGQVIKFLAKCLLVPIHITLPESFIKVFKDEVHRSYVLGVKKKVSKSETSPEPVLAHKRSLRSNDRPILIEIVKFAKLKKHFKLDIDLLGIFTVLIG